MYVEILKIKERCLILNAIGFSYLFDICYKYVGIQTPTNNYCQNYCGQSMCSVFDYWVSWVSEYIMKSWFICVFLHIVNPTKVFVKIIRLYGYYLCYVTVVVVHWLPPVDLYIKDKVMRLNYLIIGISSFV